jgi:regulator of sigma E protease
MLVIAVWLYLIVYNVAIAVAAARAGAKVERIVIGYGPRLVLLRFRGVEFCVGPLLLGGYTQVERDEATGEFMPTVPRPRRVLALAAGPLSSLVLAVLVLWVSAWKGRTEPRFVREPARIDWCRPGSSLAVAGLRPGDQVVAADLGSGRVPTPSWRDLVGVLSRSTGRTLRLDVRRQGASIQISAPVEDTALLDVAHAMPPVIGEVKEGSPAKRAGFKPGDRVASVNGAPTPHYLDVELALFPAGPRKQAEVRVTRAGRPVVMTVAPDQLETPRAFGLAPVAEPTESVPLGPGAALTAAAREPFEVATILPRMLLMRGEYAPHLRGHFAGDNGYTWLVLLMFAAGTGKIVVAIGLLGVALGFFNLLPLPGLIGWQIVRTTLGRITRRRMPPSLEASVNAVGTLAVLAYLVVVIVIQSRAP